MAATEATAAGRTRGDALRSYGPILLLLLAAVGFLSGLLLGGVCAVWVRESNGLVSCTPLLPAAIGSAIILASAAAGGLGIYFVFFRKESFVHVCGECGRTYRDHSLLSERRARGKMMCSAECEEKVETRARLADLETKVAALEAMAERAPAGTEKTQAMERLEEIASFGTEPVRTQARDALRRIGSG